MPIQKTKPNTRWFRDLLAERGTSQRQLAKHLGMDAAAISLTLRGLRTMKMQEAAAIAKLLGVPADEVMHHAGVSIDSGHKDVPLIAEVDGVGEVHMLGKNSGKVPHPGGNLPPKLNASICRTAGTPMDHMDGWLLYTEQPGQGVPSDSIGRLSICKMQGGVMYVAKVSRGYRRGLWCLSGPAANARDVELEWATPVVLIGT